MNRDQIIRDTLIRLIDAIHDAEDINDEGASNLPGDIGVACSEAERVLAPANGGDDVYTSHDARDDLEVLNEGIKSVPYLNYPMDEIWKSMRRLRDYIGPEDT